MAMLPVLLDMVNDIYGNLEDPSQPSSHIPLLFLHQRPSTATGCGKGMRCGPENRCRRGPMMSGCQIPKGKRCGKGCPRGNCAATPLSDDYEVSFDVKSFKPEEIEVKVKDRTIHVEAKHEEREDELGFVSRQFARRFVLPQEFDPDTISTFLNAEGKMTIKAAKPKPPVDETKERVIPIQRLAADAAPSTPPSEPEWEKVEDGEKAKKVDKPTEE